MAIESAEALSSKDTHFERPRAAASHLPEATIIVTAAHGAQQTT